MKSLFIITFLLFVAVINIGRTGSRKYGVKTMASRFKIFNGGFYVRTICNSGTAS